VTNLSWPTSDDFLFQNGRHFCGWLEQWWKNFVHYAIPTREEWLADVQVSPKYSISERVVVFGIGKKKCTQVAVRSENAGELAGSSFSQLGAVLL
jgi:hypothetical protein